MFAEMFTTARNRRTSSANKSVTVTCYSLLQKFVNEINIVTCNVTMTEKETICVRMCARMRVRTYVLYYNYYYYLFIYRG